MCDAISFPLRPLFLCQIDAGDNVLFAIKLAFFGFSPGCEVCSNCNGFEAEFFLDGVPEKAEVFN